MLLLLLVAIPLLWYLIRNGNDVQGQKEADRIEVPENRLNQNPTIAESGKNAENVSPLAPADETITGTEEVEQPIVSTDQTKDETESISEINVDSKNQKNNTLDPSSSTISSGECIIIVGAFGQGANMNSMIEKLRSSGYSVYVDSARTLSRVGVFSSCNQPDLNRHLDILQRDVEPNSWILNRG